MHDDAPAVSVVICAYTEDRWDDILAAVASLHAQELPPHEICLIIDHNDALLARAGAALPDVRVLPNSGPRGLSGGRNTGIAAASAPLIAFLDDDATAAPDWLARLARCCADAQVLGAGGAVVPAWEGDRPRWFPLEFGWVVGCSYIGLPTQIAPVRNIFGGAAIIRKEVFAAVGGFREGIGRADARPVGDEETELCIRARQHWPARTFLFDPDARIFHRVLASRATWKYLRSRCFAEGLSKATIVRFIGTDDGLESERAYTTRTLPRGVLRGVVDAVWRRDATGLARSAAIIVGFTWTLAGYAVGTLGTLTARRAKGAAHVR